MVRTKAKVMRPLALVSLLPADLDAVTLFRMSFELSLLFCATHSRRIVWAEQLVVHLRSHAHILSVVDTEQRGSGGYSFPSGGRNSATHQDSQCPVPETWGWGHMPGRQVSITETGPHSSPQIGTIGQCWTWEEEMGHPP